MTIELTITSSQFKKLQHNMGTSGSLLMSSERLDDTTVNVYVRDVDVDALTDALDENQIEWRLV